MHAKETKFITSNLILPHPGINFDKSLLLQLNLSSTLKNFILFNTQKSKGVESDTPPRKFNVTARPLKTGAWKTSLGTIGFRRLFRDEVVKLSEKGMINGSWSALHVSSLLKMLLVERTRKELCKRIQFHCPHVTQASGKCSLWNDSPFATSQKKWCRKGIILKILTWIIFAGIGEHQHW